MSTGFEGMPGIVHIRIDDRLIHGQICAYWTNALQLTRIMVANDAVAVDDMRKTVLRMAAPAGVKTSLISVERAATQILAGRYTGQRILLVVDSPADIIRLMDYGMPITTFNVGNMGGKDDTEKLMRYVNVNSEQKQQFKDLLAKGVNITVQAVPQNDAEYLKDHIN